ncbi:hypothetical protein [Streptomyces atriruber]|uniref:hypothetical protein n=1 Tax=Streptomyces atriruber TaxID=545121 RepID=UPI0006E39E0A|nr:hypothetical protein [Streptomyces atriruber]
MMSPPVPTPAAGEAAFMAELRRLKAWSGLSYRELERAAAAAGEVLPYSTAATMLRRDRLPREALLVAFVVACGLDADDTRRWAAARRELAVGARPDAASAGERPEEFVESVEPEPGARSEQRTSRRDSRRRASHRGRPRLRLAFVGMAAAAAVLVGAGTAALGVTGMTVQEERTVEQSAP